MPVDTLADKKKVMSFGEIATLVLSFFGTLAAIVAIYIGVKSNKISTKSYEVSMQAFEEQRESSERQNRPVLQVNDFDVGNPRDEYFKYTITNLNTNPAKMIYVQNYVINTQEPGPDNETVNKPFVVEKNDTDVVKVFKGRKIFRPPIGSKYIPTGLQSVYVVNGIPVSSGVVSLSLRRRQPWYFGGEIYFIDQLTEKVFAYSFWVEMALRDGKLATIVLKNDTRVVEYQEIVPGKNEPNGTFDDRYQ